MHKSILIACTGNICRSPVAEALLRTLLPQNEISSAGTHALVGQACSAQIAKVAAFNGVDTHAHSAKQITKDMCRDADLILVMEKRHIEEISRLAPTARGKVMLFGKWTGGKDIPDPFRKSQELNELVFGLLQEAAEAWVKVLADEPRSKAVSTSTR